MVAGIIKARDDTISARDAEIAGLQSELDNIRAAHAPCEGLIKELKAHLARLDKELAAELEKEEALARELAEEKRKEAELEQSLKKTKADLEKDERDLAEDKKVRARGSRGVDWICKCVGAKGDRSLARRDGNASGAGGLTGWGMGDAGVREQGRRDRGSEEAAGGHGEGTS